MLLLERLDAQEELSVQALDLTRLIEGQTLGRIVVVHVEYAGQVLVEIGYTKRAQSVAGG